MLIFGEHTYNDEPARIPTVAKLVQLGSSFNIVIVDLHCLILVVFMCLTKQFGVLELSSPPWMMCWLPASGNSLRSVGM